MLEQNEQEGERAAGQLKEVESKYFGFYSERSEKLLENSKQRSDRI